MYAFLYYRVSRDMVCSIQQVHMYVHIFNCTVRVFRKNLFFPQTTATYTRGKKSIKFVSQCEFTVTPICHFLWQTYKLRQTDMQSDIGVQMGGGGRSFATLPPILGHFVRVSQKELILCLYVCMSVCLSACAFGPLKWVTRKRTHLHKMNILNDIIYSYT